jgi:sugar porter (SP) family MFS transporter
MGQGSKFHTLFICAAVFNCGLGAFFFGYNMGDLNPLQLLLQNGIYSGLPNWQVGLIGSLISAGAIPGSFFGGQLANKVGRKYAMIITDLIAICGVMLTLVQEIYILLIGRFLCGVAAGLNSSLVPLYINEVSPVEYNGVTGSMNQVLICLGVLASYLMGYGVPYTPVGDVTYNDYYWRIILSVPGCVMALRTIMLLTVLRYETPKYLIYRSREEDARQVLHKIYSHDIASEQLMRLKADQEKQNMEGRVTYSELFSKKYRKRIIVGIFLSIFQQVSGINALITYSTSLFIGTTPDNASLSDKEESYDEGRQLTVLFGVVNMVTPLITSAITTKVGRRTLLITGTAVDMVALFVYSFSGSIPIITKIAVFVYTIGFGFSLGPIVWLYIAEILPDIGVGVAVVFNWSFAMIVVQVYPLLPDSWGDYRFLTFGVCMIAGLLFMIFFVKETKDKQPNEIADMYAPVEDDSTTNVGRLLKRKIEL